MDGNEPSVNDEFVRELLAAVAAKEKEMRSESAKRGWAERKRRQAAQEEASTKTMEGVTA